MKIKFLPILFSLLLLISTTSTAQDYAAALKVSSLGASIEVVRSFGESFNGKLGFNYFSISQSVNDESEDFTADYDVKLTSLSAIVDWFPISSSAFRLSGGLMINLNVADAFLTPTGTFTSGGDVYTAEELGDLKANITFNKVAPYIGIGFGNPTSGDSGFGFTFDLGTMYQGGAVVDLTADGLLAPTAAEDQEKLIEDNLSWFKWFPVISLGVTYKF